MLWCLVANVHFRGPSEGNPGENMEGRASKKTSSPPRLNRWWFPIFLNFHLYLGKTNPVWRPYFPDGLVQPPTSSSCEHFSEPPNYPEKCITKESRRDMYNVFVPQLHWQTNLNDRPFLILTDIYKHVTYTWMYLVFIHLYFTMHLTKATLLICNQTYITPTHAIPFAALTWIWPFQPDKTSWILTWN